MRRTLPLRNEVTANELAAEAWANSWKALWRAQSHRDSGNRIWAKLWLRRCRSWRKQRLAAELVRSRPA